MKLKKLGKSKNLKTSPGKFEEMETGAFPDSISLLHIIKKQKGKKKQWIFKNLSIQIRFAIICRNSSISQPPWKLPGVYINVKHLV